MVSERCGLRDVQGSLLNQYPTVRPQFRDASLFLKKGRTAAASLKVSCSFSLCELNLNLICNSVSQLDVFLMCFSSFKNQNSFTFCDCWFFVGFHLGQNSLEKHKSISRDCPFFKERSTKTCTQCVISCSNTDCRLTGDHIYILHSIREWFRALPCFFLLSWTFAVMEKTIKHRHFKKVSC